MDPLELGKLLILLGGIAALYVKFNQAMRSFAGKGEGREITNVPLHTQDTPRPATIEDVERLDVRIDALESRIDTHIESSRSDLRNVEDTLEARCDKIDDRLYNMNETLRAIERSVGRLEGS